MTPRDENTKSHYSPKFAVNGFLESFPERVFTICILSRKRSEPLGKAHSIWPTATFYNEF
jgi:hypothetical protein